MGDARKVQDFIPLRSDIVAADARKPARPNHRITTIAVAAALLFAAAATAAGYQWYQARRAFNDSIATMASLVEATSETVQPNAQGENVEALLNLARKALSSISSSSDPHIIEQRARSYLILAEIDFERGWIDRMQDDAQMAFANLDSLANTDNLEARHLRAQAERLIGITHWERGNNQEAKLHFERGIADLGDLLKRNVDAAIAWRWIRSLADLYQAQGDVLLFRFGQSSEALAAYNKSRELRERLIDLGHQGPALEHDLAWITNRQAEVAEREGDTDEALKRTTDARDRMDALKDRIWDNLRWAADYGTVNANIARLKRKQKRYAEAAPIFARAEEIFVTVGKRDPKNASRTATLNRVRFLRAENLFRLGVQNNDRIRVLSAREQAQAVIAATTALAGDTSLAGRMRLNKVREEAFLAAIDATLRQLNGNYESAAVGFIEASDIIANGYLSDAKRMPWGDLITENIEYLEWAGVANVKAQKPAEAQALFKRALDMLDTYRALLGEKVFEDFHQRIDARYDRAPPATSSRAPRATERAPVTTESIPPASERTPPAADSAPPAAAQTPVTENPSPAERAPPAAERTPGATDPVSPPPQ